MKKLVVYRDKRGKEPYTKWLEKIKDLSMRARVEQRIRRLECGHYGDCRTVGGGVMELRLFFGSGYRVYFAEYGEMVVVLLRGGDKASQKRDIENAKAYWQWRRMSMDYRNFTDALHERLQDGKYACAYLSVALETYEEDGDTQAFLLALRDVADARGGMTKLAEKTSLNRQSLYKALSPQGNPRLDTLGNILHGLGFRLDIVPLAAP